VKVSRMYRRLKRSGISQNNTMDVQRICQNKFTCQNNAFDSNLNTFRRTMHGKVFRKSVRSHTSTQNSTLIINRILKKIKSAESKHEFPGSGSRTTTPSYIVGQYYSSLDPGKNRKPPSRYTMMKNSQIKYLFVSRFFYLKKKWTL
jgi:hypothetical protein